MDDVLWTIQRISDGYILCSMEPENSDEFVSPDWFPPHNVPPVYGYVYIEEKEFGAYEWLDTEVREKLLPVMILDTTGEHYDVGELQFVQVIVQSTEPPMMLQ